MRGNHCKTVRGVQQVGSIPARAGEPQLLADPDPQVQVYPRACGGTRTRRPRQRLTKGLSPRVRGNQVNRTAAATSARSIPARAGEPYRSSGKVWAFKVYPRACGGTFPPSATGRWATGLSPRVRGNRCKVMVGQNRSGSIPARAGEPIDHLAEDALASVYPRACGGTCLDHGSHSSHIGLSPRVRGNRPQQPEGVLGFGSIPARAGEPICNAAANGLLTVYPRACGGTTRRLPNWTPETGLSPRVRGNHASGAMRPFPERSIPARAGEPAAMPAVISGARVYPRACGGTRRALAEVPDVEFDTCG